MTGDGRSFAIRLSINPQKEISLPMHRLDILHSILLKSWILHMQIAQILADINCCRALLPT